jgi:aminopeptidase-like protein
MATTDQDISDKKIKEIIVLFLCGKKSEIIYPIDIANKFNLEPRRVFDICQKLKHDGVIVSS